MAFQEVAVHAPTVKEIIAPSLHGDADVSVFLKPVSLTCVNAEIH